MITVYDARGEAMVVEGDMTPDSLPDDIVWIDLLRPDKAEDHLIERFLASRFRRGKT